MSFFASTGDPGATTGIVKVYQKSGNLFAQVPATNVYQITPVSAPSAHSEWLAVDEMTLSAATGNKTFKSGGDGSQNYAVNGDTDLWYRLTWDLTGGASGLGAVIQFNNAGSTNQTIQTMQGLNAVASAAQVATNFTLGGLGTAAGRNAGEWICRRTNTSAIRTGYAYRITQIPASATDQLIVGGWLYNDSATNITEIDINITAGDATGQIVLWKKAPFPWEI